MARGSDSKDFISKQEFIRFCLNNKDMFIIFIDKVNKKYLKQ